MQTIWRPSEPSLYPITQPLNLALFSFVPDLGQHDFWKRNFVYSVLIRTTFGSHPSPLRASSVSAVSGLSLTSKFGVSLLLDIVSFDASFDVVSSAMAASSRAFFNNSWSSICGSLLSLLVVICLWCFSNSVGSLFRLNSRLASISTLAKSSGLGASKGCLNSPSNNWGLEPDWVSIGRILDLSVNKLFGSSKHLLSKKTVEILIYPNSHCLLFHDCRRLLPAVQKRRPPSDCHNPVLRID